MLLNGKKIIFGLTSSQYAFKKTIPQIGKLIAEGAKIYPVMSYDAYNIDTKYGKAKDFVKQIEEMTLKKVIQTNEGIDNLEEADLMVICPCSGNAISKIATGIMDTPILKATKKILKEDKNLILGIATSDGLSVNAENIGKLLNRKNIYFIPFRQDNPITKPRSLAFESRYILDTIIYSLKKEQVQPILLWELNKTKRVTLTIFMLTLNLLWCFGLFPLIFLKNYRIIGKSILSSFVIKILKLIIKVYKILWQK